MNFGKGLQTILKLSFVPQQFKLRSKRLGFGRIYRYKDEVSKVLTNMIFSKYEFEQS